MKPFALLASVAWAVACSNPTAPEVVTVPAFIDSLPASVMVGSAMLRVESFAWRDFMPIQPDDRMIVVLRVRADGGKALPPGITVNRAWIVHNREAWVTTPQQEQAGSAYELEVVARQGPRWPTGDSIFAAIAFRIAGAGAYRIRGPMQVLQRTD